MQHWKLVFLQFKRKKNFENTSEIELEFLFKLKEIFFFLFFSSKLGLVKREVIMRIVKIFESQTTVNKRFVLLPLKKSF